MLKIQLWKGIHVFCDFPKRKTSTENKASIYKYFRTYFESYYKQEQTFKKQIMYKKEQNDNSLICMLREINH